MEVEATPRSATPSPYQHQACRQRQFFANIEQVETPAVHDLNGVHVLPGNHDKEVEEKPPREQKCEIEGSDSERATILLNMGLECHCCHHRNNVQEKNHVPDKWIRRLMPQVDFQISPHELRSQPHGQT